MLISKARGSAYQVQNRHQHLKPILSRCSLFDMAVYNLHASIMANHVITTFIYAGYEVKRVLNMMYNNSRHRLTISNIYGTAARYLQDYIPSSNPELFASTTFLDLRLQ